VRASPLARAACAVYALLIVYGSLYPFTGWRNQGLSPFDFVVAPAPRFVTAFDVAANLIGYVPYGFLCVLALHPRLQGTRALGVGALSGTLLSLCMEALQTYLPTRFASNLDVLCNLGGTLAGSALALRFVPWLLGTGPLHRARSALFQPGLAADLGLVLLGLWLFTQLDPTTLLFGAGDLRNLLAGTGGTLHAPELFVSVEALTCGANLVAVALLLSVIAPPTSPVRVVFLTLVLVALAVKTAAFSILMRAENVLAWLTPGAWQGLVVGALAALAAVALPRVARIACAAVLLMAATVLVNLAPPNPYLAASLTLWQQGHFLNFNGLTRLVSSMWPFAALGYLTWVGARRTVLG
jgi:VanZ family protein